jgi:hypothetical protein
MNTKEKIEIMQAHLDGKEIEYKDPNDGWKITSNPVWNFRAYEYRIKKEPEYHTCEHKVFAPKEYYGNKTLKMVEIKALKDALELLDKLDYHELDPRDYKQWEAIKELIK